MNYLEIAQKLLLVHEGSKQTEYRCTAGHRTIGVGWNIDAHPLPKGFGKMINGKLTITQAEADDMLKVSMREHYEDLITKLPWVEKLDEWRKAAMLDLAFNMGIGGLLTFKNTLGFISTGRYAEAGAGLLKSKWAKDVQKQRVDTIVSIITRGMIDDKQKQVYGL